LVTAGGVYSRLHESWQRGTTETTTQRTQG
jgi:hypothetical protein